MGYGHQGQLGNGKSGYTCRAYRPILVSSSSRMIAVAAMANQVMAPFHLFVTYLSDDGQLRVLRALVTECGFGCGWDELGLGLQ